MDASTSIGQLDFEKEKTFVKDVARSLHVGPTESQVAVITYSDNATLQFKFGEYSNVDSFEDAVDGLPYIMGRTRIDKALGLAADSLFTPAGGTRPGLPKIMIILTDGEQTQDPDAVSLEQAIAPLKNLGVKTFAVGIGGSVSPSELRLLVDEDEDVLNVQDFDALLEKAHEIARRACGAAQGNIVKCSEAAYVGFILDESGSIGESDFKKEKHFVKDIASIFRTGPGNSSFGLITFSDAATVHAQFGDHSDLRSFEAELDALSQAKGKTRIDKALEAAANNLFGSLGSASLALPKVLVILTDGSQTPAPDAVPLNKAILPLRKLGVRVLAVGITYSIDVAELTMLVERDKDIFRANDFDNLLGKAREIAEATCKLSAKVLPCSRKVDFGFVMDTSGSIGTRNFQKEKYFVDAVASSIIADGQGPQVGLISYSDNATLHAKFGDSSSLDDLRRLVDSVPYTKGRTRIDKALKLATTDLFQAAAVARPDIPKVLLILTDGKQTRDPDALALDAAVLPLRALGVRVFAVGIGSYVDVNELLRMVGSRENLFTVRDFDDLLLRTQEIANKTCAEAKPLLVDGKWTNWGAWSSCSLSCNGGSQFRLRTCTNPPPANGGRNCTGDEQNSRACGTYPCSEKTCKDKADVVFVVDSSGSIGSREFQREKEFVKALASEFRISSSDTQTGLICYSDYAIVLAKFGDYTRIADFKKAVDRLPHLRGRTRIDLALKVAATELFTERNGGRRANTKILFILTDGKQTNVQEATPLNEAVKPLKNAGVRVFAVGIGSHVDGEELRSMVDNDRDVLRVNDFEELILKAQEIAGKTCKPVPPTPAPQDYECHTTADVGFLVDSSGSIGNDDFEREREFVKAMVSIFTVGPSRVRVGVITYSDTPSLDIRFDQYATSREYRDAVQKLTYAGGRTRIDLALRLATTKLFTSGFGSRPGVPKVLVVLTDGQQTPAYDAIPIRDAIEPIRQAGIRVQAVGVGSFADPVELRLLVEKEQDLFFFRNFHELLRRTDEISNATMCRVKPS